MLESQLSSLFCMCQLSKDTAKLQRAVNQNLINFYLFKKYLNKHNCVLFAVELPYRLVIQH